MTAALPQPLRVVLYEGAGSRPLQPAERLSILQTLLPKGYMVTSVTAPPDGGPADGGPAAVSTPNAGTVIVLGRFLDEKPGQPLTGEAGVRCVFRSVDGLDAAGVLALVDSVRDEFHLPKPGGWKPWFPVIDYGRCTNCMQCLSFCLFDVYGVTGGKITVQNQKNCKTDCPACSRVCPEVAILFPKYRHGPINGDEVNSEDVRREAMKVDISALLGGDIYQALRDRSARAKSRFSKERDDERALQERQRCLAKLQKEMDIPAEVLASLPSPDQIRAKAEQAKARADAARSLANS